jgi:23S rRNA (cytidine2498-2'-O)-methyltransferase
MALQEQLSAPNRYVMHMMHRWTGDERPRHIATSYPRFHKHATRELRQIDPDLEAAGILDAGTTQLRSGRPGHDIRSALAADPAVFVHHAAPVTEEIPLAGDRTDIAVITAAVRHMRLPTDFSYAVECRKGRSTIAGPHTVAAYTTRDIEIAVGTALAADSHSIELRHPDRVISIYLSDSSALMGVHAGEFADRMRRTPPTLVSRAEHKLAEALDIFRINVAAGQNALDLGAAPGGWSYLLAERGMTVTAVDPGELAPAVETHPDITHIRGRAEDLRLPPASFTLAVNDMNMDPADSAYVMCSIADLLLPEGHAVLTIKLPGRADRGIAAATAVLESAYDIVDIRHLPHNRQEVTALLRPRNDEASLRT